MPRGSNQNPIPDPRFQPSGLDEMLHSVRRTFETLRSWGCSGFSCSEQTMVKLDGWTAAMATTGTQKEILDHIHAELENCRRCGLSRHRRHILFGHGSASADLVFVRQMPSKEEDQSGHFQHGPAGQLLLKMIAAMKMTTEQVYICNVVKCAGPATSTDIQTCLPFLKRQLKAIDPKVICALGEGPAQILLDHSDPIASVRGRFYNYDSSKIMTTLDPAFLLDHPDEKRLVWEDLKKIMAYLSIPL